MTPSVGRIVHYALSDGDVDTITRDYPDRNTRNSVSPGQVFPAMMVATWGGEYVNLQVFLDGACTYWATSRGEGDEPGKWLWPSREEATP